LFNFNLHYNGIVSVTAYVRKKTEVGWYYKTVL